MALVKIEGKTLTIPDEICKAGKDAIKAALSVDFPAVENAQIEIVESKKEGAPAIITVTKRATPKGSGLDQVTDALLASLPYVNPAVELAARVMRAELESDPDFLDRAVRSGQLERAIEEGSREGRDVMNALKSLGHSVPQASNVVPVGF